MEEKRMTGFAYVLDRVSLTVVGILFAFIDIGLLLLSGFSTSVVSLSEKSYLLGDSMTLHILSSVLFLAVLAVVRFKRETLIRGIRKLPVCHQMGFAQAKRCLLTVLFLLGMAWVLAAQLQPRADQNAVLQAAAGLHTKNYLYFAPGEYISKFPHQNGMLLFLYVLGLVFGNNNFLIFQILNVFGLVAVYKLLSEIGGHMGLRKGGQLAVLLAGIWFCPLTFYTTFVYGNILGLAFALAAIKQELLLFEDGRMRRIFLAAVYIAVGILFKSNYLIFLVAMVICAVLEAVKQKKLSFLAMVVLMLVFYAGQSVAPRLLIQLKTGYDMSGGVSSWSYIAMGLQENDDRAPGWYNYYNDNTYQHVEYDSTAQAELSKADIAQSLAQFASGERDAIRFFSRKTASQWNNPTFQCFWIAQSNYSDVQRSGWVRKVLSIPFTDTVSVWLGMIQFWILFGSLLSLVLCRGAYRKGAFVLQMLVIGGFVFHLFWEAKSQYTLSYFVLLIPMAVAGFGTVLDRLEQMCSAQGSAQPVEKKTVSKTVVVCVVLFCAAVVSYVSPSAALFLCPNQDTEAWQLYVQQHTPQVLTDGEYLIAPHLTDGGTLGMAEDGTIVLNDGTSVRLISYDDVTRIRIEDSYLEISDASGERCVVQGSARTVSQDQEWTLSSAGEEGLYYICNPGGKNGAPGMYALTLAEDGSIGAELLNGSDVQKWHISAP